VLLDMVAAVVPMAPDDGNGSFFVWGDASSSIPEVRKGERSMLWRCTVSVIRMFTAPCRAIARPLRLQGLHATPLLAVLVVIEATDMVFAADSIPAVLSVTTDPFVAYTSNILAVLGLRALFFALAAAMTRFAYLGVALGVILLFIGAKLLLSLLAVHVALETTLAVVVGTLLIAGVASVIRPAPTPAVLADVSVSV
jgi:predicted tellurium resistance membrane protein TerC